MHYNLKSHEASSQKAGMQPSRMGVVTTPKPKYKEGAYWTHMDKKEFGGLVLGLKMPFFADSRDKINLTTQ